MSKCFEKNTDLISHLGVHRAQLNYNLKKLCKLKKPDLIGLISKVEDRTSGFVKICQYNFLCQNTRFNSLIEFEN